MDNESLPRSQEVIEETSRRIVELSQAGAWPTDFKVDIQDSLLEFMFHVRNTPMVEEELMILISGILRATFNMGREYERETRRREHTGS